MKKAKEYPTLVCLNCAIRYGGKVLKGHTATYHIGTCDVCGKKETITEARDYGHLPRWRKK